MNTNILLPAEVKKATNWIIIFSISLIVLGGLAILLPVIAAALFTAMIGWITLISGILMIVQSLRCQPVRGFWLTLVTGIFYTLAGFFILFNILKAALFLTLSFGILFILEGILTIVMGLTNRVGRTMSWLVVINGIVTLILGILVINGWPSSASWFIGLYVGLSIFLSGISLLAAALAVRKTVTDSPKNGATSP